MAPLRCAELRLPRESVNSGNNYNTSYSEQVSRSKFCQKEKKGQLNLLRDKPKSKIETDDVEALMTFPAGSLYRRRAKPSCNKTRNEHEMKVRTNLTKIHFLLHLEFFGWSLEMNFPSLW